MSRNWKPHYQPVIPSLSGISYGERRQRLFSANLSAATIYLEAEQGTSDPDRISAAFEYFTIHSILEQTGNGKYRVDRYLTEAEIDQHPFTTNHSVLKLHKDDMIGPYHLAQGEDGYIYANLSSHPVLARLECSKLPPGISWTDPKLFRPSFFKRMSLLVFVEVPDPSHLVESGDKAFRYVGNFYPRYYATRTLGSDVASHINHDYERRGRDALSNGKYTRAHASRSPLVAFQYSLDLHDDNPFNAYLNAPRARGCNSYEIW